MMRNYDLVPTRGDLQSKKGTFGIPIQLAANYFGFKAKPNFLIYKYRVDFNDEVLEEQMLVKKKLVAQHNQILPQYIFDGSMIFSVERLFTVSTDRLVLSLESRKYDKEKKEPNISIVEITLKSVGEVSPSDHNYIHVVNTLWGNAMEKRNLNQMNRNYYDPVAAIGMPDFRLEIWLSYITTVRQQENQLLLCEI